MSNEYGISFNHEVVLEQLQYMLSKKNILRDRVSKRMFKMY